uniref:Uncharacterized protein n=1 Tax=Kalanchoe fedtschenkoi TaxID=63787 RepID=A0A7N0V9U1_KALFE
MSMKNIKKVLNRVLHGKIFRSRSGVNRSYVMLNYSFKIHNPNFLNNSEFMRSSCLIDFGTRLVDANN